MKLGPLKDAPEFERLATSSGTAPKAAPDAGGQYGAGIIEDVSVCARGPALGHGFWIDQDFIESVTMAANADQRVKSRFTHPGLCSDGMGKALGTIDQVKTVGDRSIGNLSFFKSAHIAPDGDLAEYVASLAKESPESFGLSIVFKHDFLAETKFALANGAEMDEDDDGFPFVNYTNFTSPDPLNVENLPHCRLAELKACDVVDEPAANPTGLFHRENTLMTEGVKLLDYVLGQSKSAPALSSLGVAPERLRSFVYQYLAGKGLSVAPIPQEGDMPPEKSKTDPADDKKPDDAVPEDKKKKKPDEAPASGEEDQADEGEDSAKKKTSGCASTDPVKSGLAKFCEVFGHEDGARMFLEGVSFEEAQTKHIASLSERLKDRDAKLKAFAESGVPPVAASFAQDKKRDKSNGDVADKGTTGEQLSNRDKFAALNKPIAGRPETQE